MLELMPTIKRFAPIIFFHRQEKFFPCSIEFLLKDSVLRSAKDPSFRVINPTQQTLATYHTQDYFVEINPAQYAGMLTGKQVQAPIYVAIQQFEDCLEISYILLYAFQGGQTCQGFINNQKAEVFDCIINTYGQHQGELERILVRLVPDAQTAYKVAAVGYEAHGRMRYFAPEYVPFAGEHPIVYAALHGHSCRNRVVEASPLEEFSYKSKAGGFAIVGLFDAGGVVWRTYDEAQFRLIGLQQGKPINEEVWAKFAGRLGAKLVYGLTQATYLDGTKLSLPHQVFVKLAYTIARPFIPPIFQYSLGPIGPGGREFIEPGSGKRLLKSP